MTTPISRDLVERAKRLNIHLARTNGADFNRYVLRDEETGGTIENSPTHLEMHRLMDAHPKLVMHAHVEAGKSSAVSVGRALYELGKNRNLRILVVSGALRQARKIIAACTKYIESSPEMKEVFPHVRPGTMWNQDAIMVERDHISRDPSIQAIGVHGALLGARVDLLILDDILDYENTRTLQQREELLAWYRATVGGRTTRHARIWALGTAWTPDDLLHVLAKQKHFVHRRFPMLDDKGQPTWPERWPIERVREKIVELGGDGSIEVMRQIFVQPMEQASQRFQEVWIKKALDLGSGIDMLPTLAGCVLEDGCYVAVGVDLGFSKPNQRGAKTVFTVVLFYPDGVRQLLWIDSGHFTGPEIVVKAIRYHMIYQATVFVESNGAQRLILDFAMDPLYADAIRQLLGTEFDAGYIPVMPFQTNMNKWHPTFGVESLGMEMSAGKWIFPSENGQAATPEVGDLVGAMRGYNPHEHTPDVLMSLWICREGGRGQRLRMEGIGKARVFSRAS